MDTRNIAIPTKRLLSSRISFSTVPLKVRGDNRMTVPVITLLAGKAL